MAAEDDVQKASLFRRALASLMASAAILLVSIFVMLLGYSMLAGAMADGDADQLIGFLKYAFLPHAILPAVVAIACAAMMKQPKTTRGSFAVYLFVALCANGWLVVCTFAFALVAMDGSTGAFPE